MHIIIYFVAAVHQDHVRASWALSHWTFRVGIKWHWGCIPPSLRRRRRAVVASSFIPVLCSLAPQLPSSPLTQFLHRTHFFTILWSTPDSYGRLLFYEALLQEGVYWKKLSTAASSYGQPYSLKHRNVTYSFIPAPSDSTAITHLRAWNAVVVWWANLLQISAFSLAFHPEV